MNNYIDDSRGTVMDFEEWQRLLIGTKLSEQDRLSRIPMLGQSGEVFPFSSTNGNRGFLILGIRAYAEVWDSEGVHRIRIDFEGSSSSAVVVPAITQELAALPWVTTKTNKAEMATPNQPSD